MNTCNYALFEILKFKIEFLECLEYSMETYSLNETEITTNIVYLNNNFKNGMYKEIISTLFTDYAKINSSLKIFFNRYSTKKIIKMINSKSAAKKLSFIKNIIDCYHILENIIISFFDEAELKKHIHPKIIELQNTNSSHFINFLYFIMFNMYNCSHYPDKTKLIFKLKDIKEIISILKYCNKDNLFEKSFKILEENNEEKINEELKKISNICIELEKKQNSLLNEIINILNEKIQNNKN